MARAPRSIDIRRLLDAPLAAEPFGHVIVPRFVRADWLSPVMTDFPPVPERGSYPVGVTHFGAAFAALLDDLRSPEMRAAVEGKFGIDLTDRPMMVTVRGCLAPGDGRVHTDTATKLVTLLIYVNESWSQPGGRLRLLHSADLGDYAVEVPPVDGTLVMFRPSQQSLHGHLPAAGPRRVIQVNWLVDDRVRRREELRHTVSYWSKSLRHALRPRRAAA